MRIPSFGVGTFRLKDHIVFESVKTALSLGYRAIDTAQIYGNEKEVGMAIAESNIPRSEIFITTKIWVDHYASDALIPSLQESLEKLGMDYVDLTLIHWPAPNQPIPVSSYMQTLFNAKKAGLTREIGISNFNIALTQMAIDAVGSENIATNQIELSPYLQNRRLVSFLQTQGIAVTSYMTLAYGKVLHDPVILRIAERMQATAAQVVLAWALQKGYSVIPSSTKKENLASNLAAQKMTLSRADMDLIDQLECNGREVNPAGLAPEWD